MPADQADFQRFNTPFLILHPSGKLIIRRHRMVTTSNGYQSFGNDLIE